MKHTARTISAALASVLAGVAALVPTSALPTAEAATTGAMHSYLVNARTPGQTAAAQAAAVKAGGQAVQSWPQIGVLVVRSNRTGYAATVQRIGAASVLSAGDTRMSTATEKVPTGAPVNVASAVRRIRAMSSAGVGAADPLAGLQGYLATDRALAAHRITTGSRDVVVGVLDTGVDNSNADLARNFSAADSVDCTQGGRPNTTVNAWRGTDAHGTHVAGTIAAARNGYGVTGVAPNVKVASVKVVNTAGQTYPEFMVCGYMWAAQRQLQVTNASLNVFDLWCGQLHLSSAALVAVTRSINYASGRGVINVSSTGNTGKDTSSQRRASCHDPIAENGTVVHVSSVTATGALSSFSSYGRPMVTIAAPGENVLSDAPRNGFELRTGTSQAAPQVAATLALMRSARPSASSTSLVATLERTAKAVPLRTVGRKCTGTPKANSCTGYGQLDTLAAVAAVR